MNSIACPEGSGSVTAPLPSSHPNGCDGHNHTPGPGFVDLERYESRPRGRHARPDRVPPTVPPRGGVAKSAAPPSSSIDRTTAPGHTVEDPVHTAPAAWPDVAPLTYRCGTADSPG